MDRRRFTVAALAALAGVVATPAFAKLYYNPDTNTWEEREISSGGRRGKAIPKEIVPYETKFKVGTIIVETGERRLYLVLPDGQAMKYGIGVGRDGFRWSGTHRITAKKEWPSWTPPATSVRTRLSAPFIRSAPVHFFSLDISLKINHSLRVSSKGPRTLLPSPDATVLFR